MIHRSQLRIQVLATGNLTAAEATELVQILATSAQLTSAASVRTSSCSFGTHINCRHQHRSMRNCRQVSTPPVIVC